ncbi:MULTISPECIES: type II secretion system F family protein [Alphaproteobacteria]|uniref:type II secretion system F family protein n=1 Tax=Alphaproteobacteria TaxID=28211 RepID=UPI0032639F48
MISALLATTSSYIKAKTYCPVTRAIETVVDHENGPTIVRDRIIAAGKTVIAIETVTQNLFTQEFYFPGERTLFLQTMASFIKSGFGAHKALRQTISLIKNPSKRADHQRALHVLDAGGEFKDAIQNVALLDNSTKAFLAAGSMAGSLGAIITPMLAFRARKTAIGRTIKSRLFLIVFEVLLALLSAIWLETSGFDLLTDLTGAGNTPEFQAAVEHAQIANRFLIAIGVAPFALSCTIFIGSRAKSSELQDFAAMVLDRIPSVGTLFRDLAAAETLTIVGLMMRATPFIPAARLATTISRCPPVRDFWTSALDLHLKNGQSVTDAVSADSGLLTEWERMPLQGNSSTRNTDLSETMLLISDTRLNQAEMAANTLLLKATFLFVAYLLANGAVLFQIMMAQNANQPDLFGVL